MLNNVLTDYLVNLINCDLNEDISRKLWLILLSIILLFLNSVNHTSKFFQNSKDSKYVLIFSLALVVVEFLAIL
jgi:hypothetical protein